MPHLNVAEFESVLKVFNLALKLELKILKMIRDSATVCGWIKIIMKKTIKNKMIVK